MGSFLAAFRFLTNIPVPWLKEDWQGEKSRLDFARSLGFYPLVGLIIGLILVGLGWVFSLFLPDVLTAALLIISLVIITGGLHLDGLTDTFDGIAAGHKSFERAQEVMHLPGVGAIGVLAAICLLLLKFSAVLSLPSESFITGLILFPLISRWAMVYAVVKYPYIRSQGLGKELKGETAKASLWCATIFCLTVCVVLGGWAGFLAMFGSWLLVMYLASFFKRRLGGLNGDTYGSINEFTEVAALVFIVALSGYFS
ncbi:MULTISPECIES: adenosylcobinamide-GDP ribazoletransferase [Dehalococcoides]|jgi:adenosylcobinamide-GDP ribazoletransferase|uniref:Adenosylcobinamide-GDP ribazoletransferase n=1 Tax=Dehalococcoides mccartyi (strain CBDB1) TaxID=255470 RepID=A0A916NZ42_DEHMC|nr:adenosylcobinamide-GDP ribazoletransferase [Dehalococcoides mccartyi]CAI82814.1 cobalamin 5'-phosphate synthase [Dehalococcoides mccartyi CBDB1]